MDITKKTIQFILILTSLIIIFALFFVGIGSLVGFVGNFFVRDDDFNFWNEFQLISAGSVLVLLAYWLFKLLRSASFYNDFKSGIDLRVHHLVFVFSLVVMVVGSVVIFSLVVEENWSGVVTLVFTIFPMAIKGVVWSVEEWRASV